MIRTISVPYLQAITTPDVTEWNVEIRDAKQAMSGTLPSWDYQTPVIFTSSVTIDIDCLRKETRVAEDAEIAATVLYNSSTTNRQGLGDLTRISAGGDYQIRLKIDPSTVGGDLTLSRMIVITKPGTTNSLLVPNRRGALIWKEPARDCKGVSLEGDAARFPSEAIDFSKAEGFDENAAWKLDMDSSDWSVSAHSVLRLYLNNRKSDIKNLISGNKSEASSLIGLVMRWDVGRTMVNRAISDDDFRNKWGDFAENSIGHAVQSLIERNFPAVSVDELKAQKTDYPENFEMRLQHVFKVIGSK